MSTRAGGIALVHNGIIENHQSIRAFLTEQGIEFVTDTDTEALAQLIGYLYHGGANGETGDLLAAVRRALSDVRGTFGIVVVSVDHPGQLIAARRGSPVLVGIGDGEHLVASDGAAVVEHTRQVVYLEDNEIALLTRDRLCASTIDDVPLNKSVDTLEVRLEEIELGGYPITCSRRSTSSRPRCATPCAAASTWPPAAWCWAAWPSANATWPATAASS